MSEKLVSEKVVSEELGSESDSKSRATLNLVIRLTAVRCGMLNADLVDAIPPNWL